MKTRHQINELKDRREQNRSRRVRARRTMTFPGYAESAQRVRGARLPRRGRRARSRFSSAVCLSLVRSESLVDLTKRNSHPKAVRRHRNVDALSLKSIEAGERRPVCGSNWDGADAPFEPDCVATRDACRYGFLSAFRHAHALSYLGYVGTRIPASTTGGCATRRPTAFRSAVDAADVAG
ncbi:hypothetical protein EVAR_55234_1 [Eumeta japonica]|uniref:Uncharacterized protein n=1 Tax=Eumeta variegata TaxID=151549 RepID=A0A4C1ZR11_EUMVA|nr:hypothetical protein EVAR_55234_1 [Eumeta japonica]